MDMGCVERSGISYESVQYDNYLLLDTLLDRIYGVN